MPYGAGTNSVDFGALVIVAVWSHNTLAFFLYFFSVFLVEFLQAHK